MVLKKILFALLLLFTYNINASSFCNTVAPQIASELYTLRFDGSHKNINDARLYVNSIITTEEKILSYIIETTWESTLQSPQSGMYPVWYGIAIKRQCLHRKTKGL